MSTYSFALAFDTSLSLQEMLLELNLHLPQWEWVEWPNDRWGDYIRGFARTNGDPRFKILFDDEVQRWAINVAFDSPIEGQLRAMAPKVLLRPAHDRRQVFYIAALETFLAKKSMKHCCSKVSRGLLRTRSLIGLLSV